MTLTRRGGPKSVRGPRTARLDHDGAGYTAGMQSWLFSPTARAVLLVLMVVPACVVQKGGTDSDGSSTDGSGSSIGETSGVSATSGAVFTSTDGLTGDTSTGTGVTTGGSMDTSSGETGSSSGTTGEPAIMCGGEDPFFPSFDRSCTMPSDCTIVFHQIDCCGSLLAWGLNGEAGKPFGEAEGECQAQYPACRCAPMPTIADDGKTVDDPNLLEVDCMEGMCQTVVP